MKEIIDRVCDKAGISADQATTAVQTVAGFLKDRLPGPIAGQIDAALGGGEGQQGAQGIVGGVASAIGDLGKQRKAG